MKIWIDRIKEEADGILSRHNGDDGGYICEICVNHIQTIIDQLKYECKKDKENRPE